MALMRGKGPTDAVAGMDPKFIRQKGQSLASPIGALRAGQRLPFFGLNRCCGSSPSGWPSPQTKLLLLTFPSLGGSFFLSFFSHRDRTPIVTPAEFAAAARSAGTKLKRENGARTVTAFENFFRWEISSRCYNTTR